MNTIDGSRASRGLETDDCHGRPESCHDKKQQQQHQRLRLQTLARTRTADDSPVYAKADTSTAPQRLTIARDTSTINICFRRAR